MAWVTEYWAYVTLMDSRKKTATVSWRSSDEVDIESWFTAETDLIRDATEAGVLMAAVAALSSCTLVERGVKHIQVDDAAVPPALESHVFTFDKLLTHYDAGLDSYTISIPGRKGSAFTVGSDGVTVIIEGAGASSEVLAFIAAFEAGALAKNGAVPNVTEINVAS